MKPGLLRFARKDGGLSVHGGQAEAHSIKEKQAVQMDRIFMII